MTTTHSQTVLTFISPLKPGGVDALTELLAGVADHLADNPYVRFPELLSLHFASFVILPDEKLGPYLVFENNFDGSLDTYLEELTGVAGDGLHTIYQHCVDYPSGPLDRTALSQYLRARVVLPSAYHIGNPGRTLARTRQESDLRRTLESSLDDVARRGQAAGGPHALRTRIQDFVRAQAPWAITAPQRQTLAEFLLPRARLYGTLLLLLALLPVVGPLGLVWLAWLRRKEQNDPVETEPLSADHVVALLGNENRKRVVQNHMASITYVKPGRFRRITLRVTLFAVNLVARCIDNGELSGIPSIHFAHWSQIDQGRRLLFLSNFDGSWENYLDDFIDKAASGLTAIWGNTIGFPKTQFLIFGGARDGTRFKAIAREKQVFTNVWYSAYPDLTVVGINANSAIREGLFRNLNPKEVRRWLWKL